ncbi:VOC family protein [Exiguobacterium flavidum]|uniref:VOC family protein n=1 Tax=Exiguobacterium flavidum TaxID=2184695 RepID=UPI000DF72CFD|nr:VOC family protein [Exiguobacterium flavidum]
MIQKIGQIAVPVKELDRAIAFYEEELGLPLLFRTETLGFLDCAGVRLILSVPESEAFAHSSILYLTVADVAATYSEKGATIRFTDEPHTVAKVGTTEMRMVFFEDSEGNTLAFMSEHQTED